MKQEILLQITEEEMRQQRTDYPKRHPSYTKLLRDLDATREKEREVEQEFGIKVRHKPQGRK